jgi:hypothetical protein
MDKHSQETVSELCATPFALMKNHFLPGQKKKKQVGIAQGEKKRAI